MKYFGIPKCPYCNKKVNIIRTWSLKRQGEYKCPRCKGISNVFLSPLIHVAAVVAVFSAGVVYFFHKYVLNEITVDTLIQVFIPFVGFYLLSLFMVYLEKPVIKKKKSLRRRREGEVQPPRKMQRKSAQRKNVYAIKEDDHVNEKIKVPVLENKPVQQPEKRISAKNSREHSGIVTHQAPKPALDPRYVREPKPVEKAPQHSIEVTMPIAPRKPDTESRVVQKIDLDGNVFQKYTDHGYVQQRMKEEDKGN